MSENALTAELRTGTGKGVARKLRAAGRIPGIVYGKGKPTQPVIVDPRALERLLHKSGSGMNTLIELSVGSAKRTVLVKDLHRDPVRGAYLHADFYEVDLLTKITVSVPVHLVGKPRGVDFGGILDHPLRELQLQCLPRDIPDRIDVDVSGLDVGSTLHVRDLTLPAGVDLVTDGALAVAGVVAPAAEEAPSAEAAATPTEPEVIGEVKPEGESS